MKKLDPNIYKHYFYIFLRELSFSQAIWMLFLAYRGMSLIQIGILESIFHITSLLMEVPTGIIADRFGRKTSRVLSLCSALISTLLMLTSFSFASFATAFVFMALGHNLESGAGDAMIYDTLLESNDDGLFMKIKGKQEMFFQIAAALALLGGGWIATYSYEWTYIATIGCYLSALAIAITFREPLLHNKENANRKSIGTLIEHCRESIEVVKKTKGLLSYVLFIEVFSLFNTTLFFYFQNFLKSIGYVEWAIGGLLASISVAGVLMALFAHKIEARIGQKKLVAIMPIWAILSIGIIAFSPFEPLGMMLLSGVSGLLFVVFPDYINRIIPSETRATLLSFESMVFSIMMIVFFPLIGSISEHYGFKVAFTIIFIVAVISLFFVRRDLLSHLDR